MSAADEDAERRQREINMFAALAAGDGIVVDDTTNSNHTAMGTFLDKELRSSVDAAGNDDDVNAMQQMLFAAANSASKWKIRERSPWRHPLTRMLRRNDPISKLPLQR